MQNFVGKRVLIIGSTGLLGQSLIREALERGAIPIGIARSNADICIDILNDLDLLNTLNVASPDIVINSAALVNLDKCEKEPAIAYLINARVVALLSEYCSENSIKFCHISTDHFFTNDGSMLHKESSKVKLVNDYARTKFAGECFAMRDVNNLVLRTNIVGFRGKKGSPTFIEWVIQELRNGGNITLFDDFFTSSIDVRTFSKCLFDLLLINASGLINLASEECVSKKTFIESLAAELSLDTSHCKLGSVNNGIDVKRAESLGLDVTRAQSLLGYRLPSLSKVINSLTSEWGSVF